MDAPPVNTPVPMHEPARFEDKVDDAGEQTNGALNAEMDKLSARRLSAHFGRTRALNDISLQFPANKVTAIIGPSGCGKSTLVRCLNRMHEVVPGARVEGEVLLDGEDIYASGVDPVQVRRRIGMVFQKPTPFPTMSIEQNVTAGFRLNGITLKHAEHDRIVERSLRQAALWDEVKDRLRRPGVSLSGGQQQRLCVARALAVEPEILLMDEPCSALDPISTARIEELLLELKVSYTIVLVTHNMQQAARTADLTAFLYAGELIEFGDTRQIFTNPARRETEDYITGRFG
jgi:phosphate transport system ATP-binding protein